MNRRIIFLLAMCSDIEAFSRPFSRGSDSRLFHHPSVPKHRSIKILLHASSSPPTPTVTISRLDSAANDWQLVYWPLLKFTVHSFLVALLLIAWEDVTCQYALPSRQLAQTTTTVFPANNPFTPTGLQRWGQSTVRGLGFGRDDRMQLDVQDDKVTASIPSYNEVMLMHRQVRVPSWKQLSTVSTTTAQPQSQAIHTLLECYQDLRNLKQQAREYQWTSLRQSLRSEPWTQLETAAAVLRPIDPAVGFEWGSCAWRHCGALADIQEAVDELDALTGVLEPFEALFCLDIVERSVRDMLAEAPWSTVATPQDWRTWQSVPPYQPHRVFASPNDPENTLESQEADETWRLDEEYVKALYELKMDGDE